MRPFLLFCLAAAALAQPPALPPRFDLPAAGPAIRKTVQPAKFIEAVGARAALLGREDGTFEAWGMPVKILRDFRLSVYFDGALEPVPLSDMAERVAITPGRVTITHAHAAFTIRQTWIAALDSPVAAVLLDIDTARPLRLRTSFQLEMRPMWPASFGGQSSWFDENERALVIGEGLRRYAAIVGSPAFTRSSEQVGHQTPDRTVLLEMDVTPEQARRHIIPIVIAASDQGGAAVRNLYRETVAGLPRMLEESAAYYREFYGRTFRVVTPEPSLNVAFEWAKYALEKGRQCDPGVGCGLVAGFGPSGASERPGFAWFFGGDALMNSWSILDYGDFLRAREVLEFQREHQRADGKMMHELTQGAALLDWSKYPYGYYHADTTPLYLQSAAAYVARTADLDFLRSSWPSLEKAYRFCLGTLDDDGLMSNRKAGAAAVETGALSGRVEKDVYLQGVWLAALDAYARLATWMSKPEEAADAKSHLERARAALDSWFVSQRGWFAFGRLTDGSSYDALSSWQGPALAHGGLSEAHARSAAASLSRPELATDWGARLFATDSPSYDPLSYNDGSVWPFVTGFAIEAQYRNHAAAGALQYLRAVAAITGVSGAGFIPEYLSGDRAQELPRAVPHQLFSSSAVIHPLISGMLGLDGDAVTGTLRFAPHLPPDWRIVRFENYRVGGSVVSGAVEREAGLLRVAVKIAGKPLDVVVSPALPPGTEVLDGGRGEPTGSDVHVTARAANAHDVVFSWRLAEGVDVLGDTAPVEPGARSHAIRVTQVESGPDRIRFELAGPAGPAHLRVWSGLDWRLQDLKSDRTTAAVEAVALRFPGAAGDYGRTELIYRKLSRR